MKPKSILLLAFALLAACSNNTPADNREDTETLGNLNGVDSNWIPMNPDMKYTYIPDSQSPSGWRLDSAPLNPVAESIDTSAPQNASTDTEQQRHKTEIQFPKGRYELSQDQALELFRWWRDTLDEQEREDISEGKRPVYIFGYGDSTATRAGGEKLARQRAEAVLKTLDPWVPGEEMDGRLASFGGLPPSISSYGRVEVWIGSIRK